jgi:putative chitinase
MTLTNTQLQAIMPQATAANVNAYLPYLNKSFASYSINTVARISAFIANLAHESMQFATIEENLNYKADRLVAVFPKYFPTLAVATPYGGNKQMIANRVYANRMGNGDEKSGDGYKFRGRGLIQLTGRDTYAACSKAVTGDENTFLSNPDLLATPQYAVASACWFWSDDKKLNDIADKPDTWTTVSNGHTYDKFQWLTMRVNGGLNGYDDRLAFFNRAKANLK